MRAQFAHFIRSVRLLLNRAAERVAARRRDGHPKLTQKALPLRQRLLGSHRLREVRQELAAMDTDKCRFDMMIAAETSLITIRYGFCFARRTWA